VPALKIYDAQSGHLLKTLLMPVTVPGTGSINSAATPVGRILFVTSGNSLRCPHELLQQAGGGAGEALRLSLKSGLRMTARRE
jgi:hypothetical protein